MIDIIIPSFKDIRIFRTIKSININKFRPILRLLIIDGGSDRSFVEEIRGKLLSHDILMSEKDKGIFDALNKGLNISNNDFVYWLGSDDFIEPDFNFESSISLFQKEEVVGVIGKTFYFNSNGLTRPLFYESTSLSKYKYGIHVPHFSSIWRRSYIGDLRFDLKYKIASDYDFFFTLLKKNRDKRTINIPDCLVFMQEGGNSSKNIRQRLKGIRELFNIHLKHTDFFSALLFIPLRYFYKIRLRNSAKSYENVRLIDSLTKLIHHF